MKTHPNLIGGDDVGGTGRPNVNPSDTTDVIGRYAQASAADVDRAVEAAQAAQPSWARRPSADRAAILDRAGSAIESDVQALSTLLSREEGKTLREARGEVLRAAQSFRYYAAQLAGPIGAVYDGTAPGLQIHTVSRPVGVVGVITPWNYPMAIPAWKIAPALAFGNSVVFKPADLVPASAWMLTQILRAAGVPPGVFNLVMGSGSVVGQRIVESPGIHAVTFTGSTSVGTRLAQDAVATGLKRVQLEMGGKNPLIVLDDARLDVAVAAAVEGAFASTGQRCTAASRLIVHRSIQAPFIDGLIARMASIRVGHALDDETTMGPAASADQLDQDVRYIEIGRLEGAELLAGGAALDRNPSGHYIEPTLFLGDRSMRINREEIFGPIACVIPVDDLDEALDVANDTDYGLTAGLISESLRAAAEFTSRAQAGILSINRSPAPTELHVPFGGLKRSSYGGREQGEAARQFFTQQVTVYTAEGRP